METQKNNQTFQYTYSAKQQEEIKNIRKKYVAPEKDKMAQLRKLDDKVTRTATMKSIIWGVIGALLLGVGMSCCMVWAGGLFAPGIVVGVVGIVFVSLAYPLYNRILKQEREKIAPEILRLSDELLQS